jgi:hypothetical protein
MMMRSVSAGTLALVTKREFSNRDHGAAGLALDWQGIERDHGAGT